MKGRSVVVVVLVEEEEEEAEVGCWFEGRLVVRFRRVDGCLGDGSVVLVAAQRGARLGAREVVEQMRARWRSACGEGTMRVMLP